VNHLALMTLYAAMLGVFFATLWRREPKAQVRLFLQIFASLMLGAIVLGWLLYFLPAGPPAPIP